MREAKDKQRTNNNSHILAWSGGNGLGQFSRSSPWILNPTVGLFLRGSPASECSFSRGCSPNLWRLSGTPSVDRRVRVVAGGGGKLETISGNCVHIKIRHLLAYLTFLAPEGHPSTAVGLRKPPLVLTTSPAPGSPRECPTADRRRGGPVPQKIPVAQSDSSPTRRGIKASHEVHTIRSQPDQRTLDVDGGARILAQNMMPNRVIRQDCPANVRRQLAAA